VSSQYGRERGGDMHNLRAPGQVRDVQAARRARAQHPREPLRGGVPRGPRPLFVRSTPRPHSLPSHAPPDRIAQSHPLPGAGLTQARFGTVGPLPPPPLVLSGHVSSLTPY
jgi:hypothetical protein